MLPTLLAQSQPLGGRFRDFSSRFGLGDDASGAPGILNQVFTTIFGFLTIIGGLAFLIYFTIGAISWITAGGDQQKVDTAKKYMTNGAVGMIIIVAAYAIISIVGTVLGFNILDPGGVISTLWGGGGGGGTDPFPYPGYPPDLPYMPD